MTTRTRQVNVFGCYARYTIEEYAHLTEVWPELGPNLIIRKTYEEASDAAILAVIHRLAEEKITEPIRIIYKPHSMVSEDPMDRFGSWGWKTL